LQAVYPVAQLLQQWLLLPLFADAGLLIFVLRSARGRVAVSICVLLYVFGMGNAAVIMAGAPGASAVEFAADILVPPLLAVFALCYSGGRHVAGMKLYRVILIFAPSLLFLGVAGSQGWSSSSPAALVYTVVYYSVVITYLALAHAEEMLSGNEPMLFGVALTLLFISGPIYDIALPGAGISVPFFPYASAAAGALFAWGVVRYKSFSLTPVAEADIKGPTKLELSPGIFLSGDVRPVGPRVLFADAVRHGVPGLYLGRTHPGAFGRDTGLRRVPAIRLAQSPYERCLPPYDLEVILHTLRDYADQAERSIILIEDFDYLVTNAGLFQTLDFVSDLANVAERSHVTMVLHSGLLTAEERAELRELGVRPQR